MPPSPPPPPSPVPLSRDRTSSLLFNAEVFFFPHRRFFFLDPTRRSILRLSFARRPFFARRVFILPPSYPSPPPSYTVRDTPPLLSRSTFSERSARLRSYEVEQSFALSHPGFSEWDSGGYYTLHATESCSDPYSTVSLKSTPSLRDSFTSIASPPDHAPRRRLRAFAASSNPHDAEKKLRTGVTVGRVFPSPSLNLSLRQVFFGIPPCSSTAAPFLVPEEEVFLRPPFD